MSTTKFTVIIALLVLAFGYVGEMDYQDRAGRACEAKGGDWDGEHCVKATTEKGK